MKNEVFVSGLIVAMLLVFVVPTGAALIETRGYWRFEGAGGTATDDMSNFDGTLLGGAARSATIFGSPVPQNGLANAQSMEFFGNDGDAVNMGQSVEVDDNDFTLEAWVNLRDASSFPLIAGKLIGGNFLDRGFELQGRPDAANGGGEAGPGKWKARFAIRFGGSQDQVLSADLEFNTWYHLAGVREGTGANAVRLYIDGNLAGSASSAHTALTSPQEFSVGGANTGGGNFGRAVNGYVDEVRLNWGALDPSEFLNVPEPATMALLSLGGVALIRRRKK
jgi:hypothetical protein